MNANTYGMKTCVHTHSGEDFEICLISRKDSEEDSTKYRSGSLLKDRLILIKRAIIPQARKVL